MNVSCRIVRMQLPGRDAPGSVAPLLRNHLDGCLACQAEAARYRKLSRALASLTSEQLEAPARLPEHVDAAIDGDVPARKPAVSNVGRVAAAAGAAVAAAGTVAVVRWLRARAA